MFRNYLKSITPLVLVVASLTIVVSVSDATGDDGLTAEEQAKALQIESRSRSTEAPVAGDDDMTRRLKRTAAGRSGKSIITSVVPIDPLPRSSSQKSTRENLENTQAEDRRVQVTRYDYATGVTIQTIVNINSGEVLAQRRKVNYGTALAEQELTEAKSLLLDSVPEIAEIVRSENTDNVSYQHLLPRFSKRSAPRYGHRLVLIWLSKPKSTAKYLVDLSTREVKKYR